MFYACLQDILDNYKKCVPQPGKMLGCLGEVCKLRRIYIKVCNSY
jgi:hypothetical protein